MIKEFQNLSDEDVNILYNAPVWVTILIAGADNEISENEIEAAISITNLKKNRARQALLDYYREVGKSFESNLKGHLTLLPSDKAEQAEILVGNLSQLNQVLPKLESSFAVQYYESLKDLARKIAEASGGVLGFLSVGYEESKLVGLKMIENPSKA